MKKHPLTKHTAILPITLCTLLFVYCGDNEGVTGNGKRFDWDIQGTWTTNDPDSVYTGTLEIEYNRITITGYGETQTPLLGDDSKRPFKTFTKGTALKGYTEEGHIYIEDAGQVKEGIPYTHWHDNPPPDFKRVDFLRFNFGGREETLKKR